MEPVYILGGGRTDFKRNLKKEGKTIRDLITEAGRKAIDDAKIDPGRSRPARWVISMPANLRNSSTSAHLCRRSIRHFMASRRCIPKLRALPARFRCCSVRNGSWADFMTSFWSSARNNRRRCRPCDGGDVLGRGGGFHIEPPEYGDFMFPKFFGSIAQIYFEKYGVSEESLARSCTRITRMPG